MVLNSTDKKTADNTSFKGFIDELIEKNYIERAKKLCEREIKKDPLDTQILIFLSKIAIKQSDLDAAIKLLLKAMENDSQNTEVQFSLAKLLYASRAFYPDAAKAAINILEQIPLGEYYEAAKIFFAQILLDSGYFKQAINKVTELLTVNPENSEAHLQLAKIFIKQGENQDAFQKLDYLISLEQHLPEVFYLFSQVVSFTELDSPYVRQMKEVLQHRKLSFRNKAFLNLALAKAYSDQADWNKVYSTYTEAANYLNKDLNYDIDLDKKLFADVKNAFGTYFQLLANTRLQQQSSSNDIRPVFVISFPGLKNQSSITELLQDTNKNYLGENSFLSQILTGSRYGDNFLHFMTQFVQLKEEDLNIFRDHYKNNVAKVVGEDCVSFVDTTKMNFLYVGLIKLLFPNAEIVYLRAAKESAMLDAYVQIFEESEMNFSYSLENLSQYYDEFASLMGYWLSLFPDIKIIDVADNICPNLLEIFSKELHSSKLG